MAKPSAPPSSCEWINQREAFKRFATYTGKTQSAKHIKPLHWYIACRLVIEGGFDPAEILPRPPFDVEIKRKRKLLHFRPELANGEEQIILGGLKTKNVDVVVTKPTIGPVLAISCKGVTKAFRNLTNRMEETIGECTNLHITYPAMVLGYFAIIRANRTVKEAEEAPDEDSDEDDSDGTSLGTQEDRSVKKIEAIKANDIAIFEDNSIADGLIRFHSALSLMTSRRGIRNEISRYEAITMALVEPSGAVPGNVIDGFPSAESSLHLKSFFETLYTRYDERYVYGAPLLANRGTTTRHEWARDSSALSSDEMKLRSLGYEPRLASS